MPSLCIESYFHGHVRAWGMFQDRFGKIRRQFIVDIHGQWDEKQQVLTLTEDFYYHDGATETRVWQFEKKDDHLYHGTAAGVRGMAVGRSQGHAFSMAYVFDLPVGGRTWRVHFDDYMFLQDDKIMFNRAVVRRWGVRLGDVYIVFNKSGAKSLFDQIEQKPAYRQAAE